ncbi:MAG: hypothetical protein CSA75_00440 [Sorangium cellulosum]|nr:MAG: hypothetical protein CSA75_00440 [Sorangium cellulosum]
MGATCFISFPAAAEDSGIDATGKGITGGALLGGELVMAVEAAFGVQNTWAYVGGGVAGAVAGGVGGYFIEDSSDSQPAYYMLAGGVALLIPTTVAVLQATSYEAPDDYVEDAPGADTAPAAEPAGPDGSTVTVTAPEAKAPTKSTGRVAITRPHIPMSLVDLHTGNLRMGVPAVEIRPTYTPVEMKKYGVDQRAELRLPIFRATF